MMRKKTIKINDPFAAREAKKYEHPVPSREFIMSYLADLGLPVRYKDLVEAFELDTEEEQEALDFRLKAMLRDGQLMEDRRHRFCLIDKLKLVAGRVVGHQDGFGFVLPDEGRERLFLPAKQMRLVFPGDRVLVFAQPGRRKAKPEAIIYEIIERNTAHVVGRFSKQAGIAFVEPDNQKIPHTVDIPSDKQASAKDGDIVVAEIESQPSTRARPIGRITEILGQHMAPGLEIEVALRAHNIPHDWPSDVAHVIKKINKKVELEKGRTDLRHLPLVTIDGVDAQDFDDAVYCEPTSRGAWRLFVAIADVSHYVLPGSELDSEAYRRGNSVYFPGRVVPMLPEVLSNEMCSLQPKVDRYCMVCEMSISAAGKLTRHRFYPAVMHSKARLTYAEVNSMLTKDDKSLQEKNADVFPHLENLYSLYKILHAAREARGAIDFDTVESRIVFSEHKKIQEIIPYERNDAHRIIEECMLLANQATALYLSSHKIPVLYRIHDRPGDEKIEDLREFLGGFSLSLKGGKKPKPIEFAKLISEIKNRPDKKLIQTVVLRSLSQAQYNPKNIGHFGLAFKEYTHFTSPIRRYPDLLVHRAIRHLFEHQEVASFEYSAEKMQLLGEHCSFTERRADEATWDVIAWLKCEFMQDKVGEEFDGTISSVTNFGLFVTLKDVYVEGLVHITSLDSDYYQYDPIRHLLRGERTSKVYRLGDPIRVQVVRVDLDDRKIDFEPA